MQTGQNGRSFDGLDVTRKAIDFQNRNTITIGAKPHENDS